MSGTASAGLRHRFSPPTPFSTTVTGFAVSGSTCTATETVPAGYTASSNCTAVALTNGVAASCTITNTQTSTTFTVNKAYSPSGPITSVPVSVTCSSGTPVAASGHGEPRHPVLDDGHRLRARLHLHGDRDRARRLHSVVRLHQRRHQQRRRCQLHDHQYPDDHYLHCQQGLLTCRTGHQRPGLRDLPQRHAVACLGHGEPRHPVLDHGHRLRPFGLHLHGHSRRRCPPTTQRRPPAPVVAISNGGAASCTITNTQTSTTFTVNKVYSPAGPATSVPVSVTCSSGTPSLRPRALANPGTPFSTTVTGFALSGSTCTATETTVPAGTQRRPTAPVSPSATAALPVARSPTPETSTTFTVNKVYSPAGPTPASRVSVTCSSGTPSPTSGTANPGTPFSTTVTGFALSGSTCTATETTCPPAYAASSTCTSVAISNGGAASCTITNTQTSTTFTVNKVYSPAGPATSVPVSVTCSSGTPSPGLGHGEPRYPFSTTVTGFALSGSTCTATETTVPAGYAASSNCTSVAISNGGAASCTITNTQTSTTFTVNKVYSPAGPATSVPVSVTCPAARRRRLGHGEPRHPVLDHGHRLRPFGLHLHGH